MTLDPQAAAELAQELTLVTRALFAQLLPATAADVVAGLAPGRPVEPPAPHLAEPAGPATPAPAPPAAAPTSPGRPVTATAAPAPVTPPTSVTPPAGVAPVSAAVPVVPVALPVPGALPVPSPTDDADLDPDDAPDHEPAVEPAPVGALPVPGLPVPSRSTTVPEAPKTDDQRHTARAEAPRVTRRSTAVLEEIAFLDE